MEFPLSHVHFPCWCKFWWWWLLRFERIAQAKLCSLSCMLMHSHDCTLTYFIFISLLKISGSRKRIGRRISWTYLPTSRKRWRRIIFLRSYYPRIASVEGRETAETGSLSIRSCKFCIRPSIFKRIRWRSSRQVHWTATCSTLSTACCTIGKTRDFAGRWSISLFAV